MGIVRFILRSKSTDGKRKRGLSVIAKRVAIVTVAISVAVMVVAFAVVAGYNEQLESNLKAAFGDYKLSGRSADARWIEEPLEVDSVMLDRISGVEGVERVIPVVQSGGVVRGGGVMSGIALLGVDSVAIAESLRGKMVQWDEGVENGEAIFLSQKKAKELSLEVGDEISVIFFKESPVLVNLTLAGIFNTHLAEIDDAVAWMDAGKLAQVSGYDAGFVDYYKITAKPNADLNELEQQLDAFTSQTMVLEGAQEQYQHIYEWVGMLNNNITLLMIIVSIVVGINIISVVLIVILENTLSIGILKSLGMRNWDLMVVYGLKTTSVALKGILAGVVLGVGFCVVQSFYKVIELDPTSYLVDAVPIKILPFEVAVVALGALVVTMAFSILPTAIIARISPDKTLKFE